MLLQILVKHQLAIKANLKARKQWPVNDQIGIDPFAPDQWEHFLASGRSMMPVRTRNIPRLGNEPDEALHVLLSLPDTLLFFWGNARPHVLWVQNLEIRQDQSRVCPVHECSYLEYLESEEMVYGLRALEAYLYQSN